MFITTGRNKTLLSLLALLVLIMVNGSLAATNGTIQINSSGTYRVLDGGTVITPNQTPPANPTNFLFFNGAINEAATTNGFAPAAASSPSSGIYKYDFIGTGNIGVLAINGNRYGMASTGYYYTAGAYSSGAIALSGTDPKNFELNFILDHEKKTPYAPSAIGVVEAQTRVNDASGNGTDQVQMTLTVSVTPNSGASPNLRTINIGTGGTTYALVFYKSGDTIPPVGGWVTNAGAVTGPALIQQNSGTFTLKGSYLTPNTQYNIIAWNRNWWTSSADTPTSFNIGSFGSDGSANYLGRQWATVAGAGGGPFSKACNLTPVINTFSLPFDFSRSVAYTTTGGASPSGTVQTVRQLLTAIGNVSVFGWYDSVEKKQKGFTYVNNANLDTSTTVPGSTQTVAQILDSNLVQDLPYQISVAGTSVTLSITGTR